jgi:hypothetical protein
MPDTLVDDMHERSDRICEEARQVIAESYRIRLQSRQLLERIHRRAVHGVLYRSAAAVTVGRNGPMSARGQTGF